MYLSEFIDDNRLIEILWLSSLELVDHKVYKAPVIVFEFVDDKVDVDPLVVLTEFVVCGLWLYSLLLMLTLWLYSLQFVDDKVDVDPVVVLTSVCG